MTASEPVPSPSRGGRTVGFLLTMLMHVGFIGLPILLGATIPAWFPVKAGAVPLLIGLLQWPYVALAYGVLRAAGLDGVAAGVMRGAVMTALVNMAGCGAFYVALRGANW